MTNRKTILLTGATGFLGGELLKRFIMLNYGIKALVRTNGDLNPEAKIRLLLTNAGFNADVVDLQTAKIQLFEGDITEDNLGLNQCALNELKDSVDEVFHCAAATKFSGLDREDLLKTNYTGTKNIIKFCVSGRGKHLHHISTAYVAGGKEGIVYENELDDSYGFRNHYEESKFFAEKVVHEYASTHRLNYTIYRPSIIVGDSRTNHTMNFDGIYVFSKALFLLKRRIESMARKDTSMLIRSLGLSHPSGGIGLNEHDGAIHIPCNISAKPDATINLVPIDYVANAIISISLDRNRANKTFHIVNPYPPTLSFLLEAIKDALNISGPEIINCNEFQTKKMTPFERLVCGSISVYDLYMRNEPFFQSINTQSILNDFHIECPKITEKFISGLIKYAIKNNWGG